MSNIYLRHISIREFIDRRLTKHLSNNNNLYRCYWKWMYRISKPLEFAAKIIGV